MCAAYNAADIFVLPTLEDNLPNTMLESMSCGTPVIAFATGGVPDVIVQEHNGLLVPPGDSVALGSAIVSLTMNSTKRNVMSNNCRNLAVERFSLEVQARNYQALYQIYWPVLPSLRNSLWKRAIGPASSVSIISPVRSFCKDTIARCIDRFYLH